MNHLANQARFFSQAQFGLVEELVTFEEGRVKFDGTYWPAILCHANFVGVPTGQKIKVIARNGIVLLCEPI